MGLSFAAQLDGGFAVKTGWMQITGVTPECATFEWHPHQIGWQCTLTRKVFRVSHEVIVVTPCYGFKLTVSRIDWPSGWVHVQIVTQKKRDGQWDVEQSAAAQRWFLPVQRF